jgi:hypothetical protein
METENTMANMPSASSPRPVWLDDKTKSIMDRAIARERSLSRLLMTYILTGLIFMLLPGTFLGVWNLIKISSREAAESISPAWIQAHGHAQLFGWAGTFILGIGFYSIPKLQKLKPFALWSAWLAWALWVIGVTVRWFSNIYPWHWRIALPLSSRLKWPPSSFSFKRSRAIARQAVRSSNIFPRPEYAFSQERRRLLRRFVSSSPA